jgi:hypothetical protein
MKKGLLPNGSEVFTFGIENSLKIFPPNTFNFKPKNHIILDEVQSSILDNFWYQYNNRREDKGYMLSILNSLAEYFNMMNKKGSISANIDIQEIKPLYVLFDGTNPGIYMTFEEIIKEKMVARKKKEDITWKKYIDINEALKQARSIIGENYYIEPKAKEYIQKCKGIDKNIPASSTQKGEASNSKRIKEEDSPKYQTYKDCLVKGVDPLDIEYVNIKIEEKFEDSKKSLKEEILKELRAEFDEKFEEIKKEYLTKYDFNLSDDDHMDIAGHGQKPE